MTLTDPKRYSRSGGDQTCIFNARQFMNDKYE